MASSSKMGKTLPKRLSAQQAMNLFMELSDNDESDLEIDSGDESDVGLMGHGSDSDRSRSSSGDRSADDDGASPQPGPSGEGGSGRGRKRPLPNFRTSRRVVLNMGGDEWKAGSVAEGTETSNNFRFIPKNGRQPGLNIDLDENSSPLTCFMKLFDDEICDHIIDSINSFAAIQVMKNTPARRRSRYNDWYPLDRYELMKFLCFLFSMGLDPRPFVRDYHSTKPHLYTEFYHELFTRDRLEVLYHTMLHVGQPDAEGKNKIEPFVNRLIEKYNAAFTPFASVAIDEMIIGWKGRWQYKQYNASKPKKYHIKSFGLVDSATGYVVNLLTYYGSDTSYNPDLDVDQTGANAVKIFHTLLEPIGKGYHIYADRWYTTRVLLEYLLERGIHFSGTVQAHRVGFPQMIKGGELRLQHMESKYWIQGEGRLLCVAWKDKKAKKPVIMVSTNAKAEDIVAKGKTKPAAIHDYNFKMNGCDRADQMLNYYGLHKRKSKKWWKKIFFWILEITCINAHILYCLPRVQAGTRRSKLRLKSFKEEMIQELSHAAALIMPDDHRVTKHHPGRPRTSNPLARLEGASHIIIHSDKDRRCQVCSTPQQKKRTNFKCEDCDVYLHPKHCFKHWHSSAIL